jgi:hypothetical protein
LPARVTKRQRHRRHRCVPFYYGFWAFQSRLLFYSIYSTLFKATGIRTAAHGALSLTKSIINSKKEGERRPGRTPQPHKKATKNVSIDNPVPGDGGCLSTPCGGGVSLPGRFSPVVTPYFSTRRAWRRRRPGNKRCVLCTCSFAVCLRASRHPHLQPVDRGPASCQRIIARWRNDMDTVLLAGNRNIYFVLFPGSSLRPADAPPAMAYDTTRNPRRDPARHILASHPSRLNAFPSLKCRNIIKPV